MPIFAMIVSPLKTQRNSRLSTRRHAQVIVIQYIQRIAKPPNCGHTPTKKHSIAVGATTPRSMIEPQKTRKKDSQHDHCS